MSQFTYASVKGYVSRLAAEVFPTTPNQIRPNMVDAFLDALKLWSGNHTNLSTTLANTLVTSISAIEPTTIRTELFISNEDAAAKTLTIWTAANGTVPLQILNPKDSISIPMSEQIEIFVQASAPNLIITAWEKRVPFENVV